MLNLAQVRQQIKSSPSTNRSRLNTRHVLGINELYRQLKDLGWQCHNLEVHSTDRVPVFRLGPASIRRNGAQGGWIVEINDEAFDAEGDLIDITAEVKCRIDARTLKAHDLVAQGQVVPNDIGHTYTVAGYHVDLTTDTCDCPDHQYRDTDCKHLQAARLISIQEPVTCNPSLKIPLTPHQQRRLAQLHRLDERLYRAVATAIQAAPDLADLAISQGLKAYLARTSQQHQEFIEAAERERQEQLEPPRNLGESIKQLLRVPHQTLNGKPRKATAEERARGWAWATGNHPEEHSVQGNLTNAHRLGAL